MGFTLQERGEYREIQKVILSLEADYLVQRTCSNLQTQKHVLMEVQSPVEILRSKNCEVEMTASKGYTGNP
jgi:hypothetical protein